MPVHRILTAPRRDAGAPSLVVKEEATATPGHGSPDLLVRSVCALVDSESLLTGAAADGPAGVLIGTVEHGAVPAGPSAGQTVVGVGPLADRVVLPPGRVQPLQADGSATAEQAFLPVLSAALDALRDVGIEPGARIGVCGEGLVARVAARLAQISSGIAPRLFMGAAGARPDTGTETPAGADDLDVLIDTTADSERWAPMLARVRREGRVLLLVPPGGSVRALDFYPGVHRRSLYLLARRVPALRPPLISEDARRLVPQILGRGPEAYEGWFVEVDVRPRGTHVPLIPTDAVAAGKGLLIRWS